MIHIFGDSHAQWSWIQLYPLQSFSKHGTTCYSFGRDKLDRLNIKNIENVNNIHQYFLCATYINNDFIKDNDIIIFSFGEVDCRNNINKYISSTKTYQCIIDEIIAKYFIAIEENINQYPNINLRVCIYNIIPTSDFENDIYNGLVENRKEYVLYFNKKLKELCNLKNYHFIDIYNQLTDSDGLLSSSYTCDKIHLNDSKILLDYLKTNILQPNEVINLHISNAMISFGDCFSSTDILDFSKWLQLFSNKYDTIKLKGQRSCSTRNILENPIQLKTPIEFDNLIKYEFYKYMSPYSCNVITILFGICDLFQKIPLEEYKNNLSKIIDIIIANYKNFSYKMVIITPPYLFSKLISRNRKFRNLIKYKEVCIEICKVNNYLCFDLYDHIQRHFKYSLYGDDEIHFSEEGHQIAYNGLLEFLQQNSIL